MNSITTTSGNNVLVGGLTLAEATVMLIEEPKELLRHPAIQHFLYQTRYTEIRPYEVLGKYYGLPTTADDHRREIIDGCLKYLQKVQDTIEGCKDRISDTSLQIFASLTYMIATHTPDLAIQVLLPRVRGLAEHCLTHFPDFYGVQPLLEAMAYLDKRDWSEQKPYWLELLGDKYAAGRAFRHIEVNDPNNPALEKAMPNILRAKLRGEIATDALMLLADLLEIRNNSASLLKDCLDAVPDELQPQLIEALSKRRFSSGWTEYLPTRAVTQSQEQLPRLERE